MCAVAAALLLLHLALSEALGFYNVVKLNVTTHHLQDACGHDLYIKCRCYCCLPGLLAQLHSLRAAAAAQGTQLPAASPTGLCKQAIAAADSLLQDAVLLLTLRSVKCCASTMWSNSSPPLHSSITMCT